ncbi:MAG: chromate transporter [Synergistaceae bacterium]|jgi:chromate transporter|nr:chromate transporter [Synergistaceae bacterium]
MLLKDLWSLLASFAKTGAVAYGGGPSMVPILKAEVVERRKWIETDDFMDALAIGNALPGPIVTKMAAAIGYRKSGWLGVAAALLGIILPSAIVLLILIGFVSLVKDNPLVTSMLRGLRPVVVAMLAYAAWDMAPNAFKGRATWIIGAVALALMIFTSIHPALIIFAGAIVGIGMKL